RADAAGDAGNQFTIDQASSTAGASFTVNGDDLTGAGVFSLQGGTDNGLASGDVTVSGSSNDSLVSSTSGSAAQQTLQFNNLADIQAGDTIEISDGEGGTITFTFSNNATNPDEIQIGSTLQETVQNAANTLNDFEG